MLVQKYCVSFCGIEIGNQGQGRNARKATAFSFTSAYFLGYIILFVLRKVTHSFDKGERQACRWSGSCHIHLGLPCRSPFSCNTFVFVLSLSLVAPLRALSPDKCLSGSLFSPSEEQGPVKQSGPERQAASFGTHLWACSHQTKGRLPQGRRPCVCLLYRMILST